MSTAEEINQTIDMLKGVYGTGPAGLAADVTKDFTTSAGFIPYNLAPGAKLLSPVITPVRNRVVRVPGRGKATEFVAVTSYNANGSGSFASEGNSGAAVDIASVHVTMPYKIQSLTNNVTFEAQFFGQGQVDAKALAVANLLRAFLVDEETNMLFGNPATAITGASAGGASVSIGGLVGASPAPTATATGTGSSLTAETFDVYQTVLTGPGQESLPSTQVTVTPTAGEDLVLTPTAHAQGLQYNLYYKSSADTKYNVVTTNGKAVTISSYAAGSATLPVADNSGNSLAYPGLLQQLLATGSGASVNTLGDVLTADDINDLFGDIWDAGKGDPRLMLAHQKESRAITKQTLGAGTPYFVQPDGAQNGAVGGFRVSRLTNEITGSLVDIVVHPTLPQGTLVAMANEMPAWYPGSDIPSVWAMEMSYDYLDGVAA